MLSDVALNALDSVSDLRLKLETLKALYDVFCSSFGLEKKEEEMVKIVKYNAANMQLISSALLSFLCDAVDKAKSAERDAEHVHDCALMEDPPLPEKEAARRVVLYTYTLEEKRQIRDQLQLMTKE